MLATISERASAVSPEIEECLVQPFIGAVTLALTEMAGTELLVQGIFHRPAAATLGDIFALIRFAGSDDGFLLSFPRPTAVALSRRILANAVEQVDESLMQDCLGEVANVVAGQAKALLAQTRFHFTFSTPIVACASLPAGPVKFDRDCVAVIFRGEPGDFALQICVRMRPGES